MASAMMFFLCLVMISWLVGYWGNSLYGYKFELNSCWQGIGVTVTGVGGIVGLAKACWEKHEIDSKYNSEQGESPYKTVSKIINDKVEVKKHDI